MIDLNISLKAPQFEIFNDDTRFKVIVAGRRFGKTYLTCMKILVYALSNSNKTIFYLAPTFRQAELIVWSQLKALIPKSLLATKPNNTKLIITLINGTRIYLFGAKEYDNIRGAGIDLAILDEFAFMKQEVWANVVRPMLAKSQGDCIFISTPNPAGGEWAKELYEGAVEGRKDWKAFHYTTIQGGLISEEEIESAKADLSDKQFKIEYEASFEMLEGLVYHAFSNANVSCDVLDDDVNIEMKRTLVIGMDFNVNPMTCVIGVKRGKELHIFDEITIADSHTDEICQEILCRYPHRKINVYPDPSGRARKTSAVGSTDFSIIESYGMYVIADNKAPFVEDRFNEVNAMLSNAKNEHRLKIHPRCKKLISSLKGFTYKERTRIPDKSKGVEHWSDALGYLIHQEYPIIQKINHESLTIQFG